MKYTFHTTVTNVEQRWLTDHVTKEGIEHKTSIGWFITVAYDKGINFSWGVGFDEPQMKAGDPCKITLEALKV